MKLRKEFDSIGSVNVPNDKLWGASTQRSNKFFNIGKILVDISIIKSIAIIKRSAAIVHAKDKVINNKISKSIIKLINSIIHKTRQNSLSGSKKNILAHYDLSNEFYQLWLDPTMTYSAAFFKEDSYTLEQAVSYTHLRAHET